MSGGYSGKFLQRQCKIQLFRDNLGEQKVLESAFFRLSEGLKSKILVTMVPPRDVLGLLQTFRFDLTRRLKRMIFTKIGDKQLNDKYSDQTHWLVLQI